MNGAPDRDRRNGRRGGPFGLGAAALGLLVAGLAGACSEPATPARVTAEVPEAYRAGESAFQAHCARCHGTRAVGTAQGPPLVHKIYEPNHHGDAAFYRAAALGVRAHHWQFGNMPKIEGVTESEVGEIVRYVRWLQQQAGIF